MDWADYSNSNIITDWNSASIIEAIPGDFNNDGNKDIAVFYRYGANGGAFDPVNVHLITSDGKGNSKTIMHWANNNNGWNSNSILKAVPGDFDNEGNDDIAVFYKYGGTIFNPMNIHLITSNGSGNSFTKMFWSTNDNSWNSDLIIQAVSSDFSFNKTSSQLSLQSFNETPLVKTLGNYPNPFKNATTITFKLEEPSFVNLKIYNVLGREVTTLLNRYMGVGIQNVNFDSVNLSSGLYFCKIEANNLSEIRTLIISK